MDKCLTVQTNYLHYNGLEYLKDLYMTSLDLISGVHKGFVHVVYLLLSIVGDLISTNHFLGPARSYTGLLPLVILDRVLLEI